MVVQALGLTDKYITDIPGLQVAKNSIPQQWCGLIDGGICISYQLVALDDLARKLYVTGHCGETS